MQGDEVPSVADRIRSFLHFSVLDERPLTDHESRLAADTSYGGVWEVSFMLKEF